MWENTHKQTPLFNNKQPNGFSEVFVYFLSLSAPFKSHAKKKKPLRSSSDQDVVEALSQRLLEVWVWFQELIGKNPAGGKVFLPRVIMSPKKGAVLVGNTSEPTIDFSGDMLVFRRVVDFLDECR